MKAFIILGAILNALAVGIGAFGAHGLKDILTKHGMEQNFETGNKYHFYHALAVLFCALLANHWTGSLINWAVAMFTVGILLFSGSLYAMGLTGITKLGMITPLGGLCFLAGWVLLVVAALRG